MAPKLNPSSHNVQNDDAPVPWSDLEVSPAPVVAGLVAPIGGEFQINSFSDGAQYQPSVSALASGGFVAVWSSDSQDGDGFGVFGQIYAADGTKSGGAIQLNTHYLDHQYTPVVTSLASGGFAAFWTSIGQDGSSDGVFGQRFDSGGVKVGGEFRVNSETGGAQASPAAAALEDGGMVVLWSSRHGQDGSLSGIFGQCYDASGNATGGEFLVNSHTAGAQYDVSVTALLSGGFVASWTSLGQDGSVEGVFGQVFDKSGDPKGSEFQINTTTANYQGSSSIVALANGGFVVVWDHYVPKTREPEAAAIFAQVFAPDGTEVGGEIQVNTTGTSLQHDPDVTWLSDGGFVVTWRLLDQDGSNYGIFGRRFDKEGSALGEEFQVNTYATNAQYDPASTTLADGRMVVTWQSKEQDGSDWGVFGQVFVMTDLPAGNVVTGTNHDDRLDRTFSDADGDTTGRGEDVVYALAGDDIVFGKSGADMLLGGAGRDKLLGGRGDDTLRGGGDNDLLKGGAGDDVLVGGGGDDKLVGNSGNDTLLGGSGNDRLTGNQNSDTFVFSAGRDVVTDFDASEAGEVIDLRDVASIQNFADLTSNHMRQSGNGLVISDDVGNAMRLKNVTITELEATDFLF